MDRLCTRPTAISVIAIVVSALILLCAVPGCATTSSKPTGRLKVTTTFIVMYIFTKNVAGDAADVTNLVPPGVGVHEYQFKPSDVKKVSNADVVVKSGLGAEMWLDNLLNNAGNQNVTIVDTSKGVPTLKTSGTVDVHIWLDPVRAEKQVENIRDGLIKKDPKNKGIYERNAAAYIKRVKALDTEIKQTVSGFQRRDFVSFHSAFIYLSDRYGLDQIAVIEPSPGKEPNPKSLAEISRIIKDKKIKAIFREPQFSSKVVDSLANDLGIKVLVLDPIETGELKEDYWEKTMRKNLQHLKEALE
ncbi:MAG: zinc ABC transporter substrate-binding protein [Bacteroidetes bacterium]|nr:zinc ABC transporter substrate-binding protein [Bacteroidota bacterium]